MRLPQPPLLVITDRRQARRPLEEVVTAAFRGGCRWLSLREKDLPPPERLALLQRLVQLAQPWGAVVSVHEDIAAAAAASVQAVHLPRDGSPAEARMLLSASCLIGVSTHDPAAIARAAARGADYVTFSPIFTSASKPGYGPPLGLAKLAQVVRDAALPVIALGGIDIAGARACIAAGAAGVAVMGGVMAAPEPEQEVAALVAAIGAALAGSGRGRHSEPTE